MITIIRNVSGGHGWDYKGHYNESWDDATYKVEECTNMEAAIEMFIGLGYCGVHCIVIDEDGKMHDNMRTPHYSKEWCEIYERRMDERQRLLETNEEVSCDTRM
jgi:hypothetical protein